MGICLCMCMSGCLCVVGGIRLRGKSILWEGVEGLEGSVPL